MLLIVFVLCSAGVFGATCNQTVVYQDAQNYTIIDDCGSAYSNQSFQYTGYMLLAMLALVGIALIFLQDPLFKAILLIPLNLLLIVMLHVGNLFMAATNPELTNVNTVMDTLFIGVTVLLIPILIIIFCYVFYQLVIRFFSPRKKNDKEWDSWQDQK
jgi:hypothetical protein